MRLQKQTGSFVFGIQMMRRQDLIGFKKDSNSVTRDARFNPFHPICKVWVIDSRPTKLHNSRIFW